MSDTKQCWTCRLERPRSEFEKNVSRRCRTCVESILRSARCRCCNRFSGLRASGEPRAYCDRPECQYEQRSRAVRKAIDARLEAIDPTKRTCPTCRLTKPLTEEHFYPTARTDGGEISRFDYYCRPCKRADQMARYHGDPKRNAADRARAKRQRGRIRKRRERDPVFDREYRRRARVYEAARRARSAAGDQGEQAGFLVDDERSPSLPPAPLIAALREREVLLEATDVGAAREALAEVAGCSVRQLWRWLDAGEGTYVRLDVADRALLGLDLLWWEVWDPDEYPAAAEVFEPEEKLLAAA